MALFMRMNNKWTHFTEVYYLIGKLFSYTVFVMLHRWVCTHVRRFHFPLNLLSKQS